MSRMSRMRTNSSIRREASWSTLDPQRTRKSLFCRTTRAGTLEVSRKRVTLPFSGYRLHPGNVRGSSRLGAGDAPRGA